MTNHNVAPPEVTLDLQDFENIEIDIPDVLVQDRMVRDIDALIEKGATQVDAVNWVFGNRKYYEADESFAMESSQVITEKNEA